MRGCDVVALPAPGILVVSSPAIVARALSPRDDTRGAARLEALALGPDEHLTWTADLKRETISGRGTLLASDERFRLEAKAELPNEEIAKEVEARFAGGPMLAAMATAAASGLDPATKDGLNRLMKAYDFRRDGKHVAFTFDLREPPAEQARDLGAAAALAVYGFRKYIASAKQAEARNTLGHLAKSIVMVWEMEDGRPQAKKRLASFPAVPKAVPKGVKYQSTPADWKPWAPLKFEMTAPQYYQYEVKAAKDGLSAEILARGDLDGDGKTSLFRMTVTIRKSDNAAVVSPSSDESDPDE